MGLRGLLITPRGGPYVHTLFMLFHTNSPHLQPHKCQTHFIRLLDIPILISFLHFSLKRCRYDLISSSTNAKHVGLYKNWAEVLWDFTRRLMDFFPGLYGHTASINVFPETLLYLNTEMSESLTKLHLWFLLALINTVTSTDRKCMPPQETDGICEQKQISTTSA